MRTGIAIAGAAALLALSSASDAQHAPQPYAGLETRPIKALSDQQVADLKAGRGMGLALAAELNGYPGPLHALELADALHLTSQQRAQLQSLYDEMKSRAVSVGDRLLQAEAALDRAFADRSMTEAALGHATRNVAELQGELRFVHLRYHLLTRGLLTAEQTNRYAALRGYSARTNESHPHGGHQPPK